MSRAHVLDTSNRAADHGRDDPDPLNRAPCTTKEKGTALFGTVPFLHLKDEGDQKSVNMPT